MHEQIDRRSAPVASSAGPPGDGPLGTVVRLVPAPFPLTLERPQTELVYVVEQSCAEAELATPRWNWLLAALQPSVGPGDGVRSPRSRITTEVALDVEAAEAE